MAHPIDVKAKAVALLAANEGNVYRTAKELGVSRATVTKWAAKAQVEPLLAEKVAEKKQHLADMCEELARKLCGVMLEDERIQAARYSELNAGFGTATDKMRLLRDQSTANIAAETGFKSDKEAAQYVYDLLIADGLTPEQAREQCNAAPFRIPLELLEEIARTKAVEAGVDPAALPAMDTCM